jgi:hypothetical protein
MAGNPAGDNMAGNPAGDNVAGNPADDNVAGNQPGDNMADNPAAADKGLGNIDETNRDNQQAGQAGGSGTP